MRLQLLIPCVFLLTCAAACQAQQSPNDDIVAMIQAGLPESSVVDKIHEGSGHWDTSVKALIALKKAGATDAEIKAITAPLAAPTQPLAAPPTQNVQFAGGLLLHNRAGDPYIQFPENRSSIFPNGERSNRAYLVSFEGKLAIRIPAQYISSKLVAGNLIISQNKVIFNPYLVENGAGEYPKHGKYVMPENASKFAEERSAFSVARSEVKLSYPKIPYLVPRCTSFSKHLHNYDVGWHLNLSNINLKSDPFLYMSTDLEQFVRDMVLDFDKLIGPLMAAAHITDAETQLSAEAHYKLITPNDFPQYAALYQTVLDHTPPPNQGSGGFASGLAGALAVVSAGTNVLQANQSGNITAAVGAQETYNQTVSQALNGDGAGATTTASNGIATTQTTIAASNPQDALNQQLTNIKSAAPASASATATNGKPFNQTFTSSLPNGGLRKVTTTGSNSTGFTVYVECFAAGATTPYQTGSARGPTEFVQNVPFCKTPPSQPTVASTPSPTVGPPVAYQPPPPSHQGTIVSSGANICPASGWIMVQTGDLDIGHQCTPGQPYTSTSGSSSGSGGGSGSSTAGMTLADPLKQCIQQSYDNGNLTFTNTCNVTVYVEWWVGARSGSWNIDSGNSQHTGYSSTEVAAAGGETNYECPKGYSPVDSSNQRIHGAVASYGCRKF